MADAKRIFLPTRSDNSIHRVHHEPEKQLDFQRSVIDNIRHDGGTPSVESIATHLSGMHAAQRASALLALQRTHVNRYVQRVVSGIQAKLVVGQPGDVYEQEPGVQRQVEPEEEEEEMLQAKPLAEEITPLVQRQVETEEEEEIWTKQLPKPYPEIVPDVETRINSIRGGGQPLPDSTREFFEPRFGYDFSRVRVHTDAKAAESARMVNALAYTVGQSIVFGAGRYAPETAQGKNILAHELVHTVQQGDQSSRLHQRKIGPADDKYKGTADHAGSHIFDGISFKADRYPNHETRLYGVIQRRVIYSGDILYEGTCEHLACNSTWACCNPQSTTSCPGKTNSNSSNECPSENWTPLFTCDSTCANAITKGCDDADNWMAIPHGRFERRKCDQDLVICANNAFTHAYVRDRSSGEHWEVSTGITDAIGVPHGTFSGAIYGDENDSDFLSDSRCRQPPTEQEQQTGPTEGEQTEETGGEET